MKLACVSANTSSSTSSREEHDSITHQQDVVLEISPLLLSQLRLGGIKRKPDVIG